MLQLLLLLLLLLENLLLLGWVHLLERMCVQVDTLLHAAHHGRVHLPPGSRHSHVATGKLLRHTTTWRTLLSGLRRHARTHGMAGNTGMSHAGRMPRKVGAHARSHLVRSFGSAIHRVDVDGWSGSAMICTCRKRRSCA
jgi:hypothetical protein